MVSSISSKSKVLSISFGISLTLTNAMITKNRAVTDLWDNILADLLVFNLLGVNSCCGANILSGWSTSLCHENINLCLAVWCHTYMMVRGSKELGISLCFRSRGSAGKGEDFCLFRILLRGREK